MRFVLLTPTMLLYIIIIVGNLTLDLYMHEMYTYGMKYEWNFERNEWLKSHRNISFEQIIFHLGQGDIWMIADHPNQEKYPGQRLYFVVVEDYVYVVPYVVDKEFIYLKTVIPSRKATKDYLKDRGEIS